MALTKRVFPLVSLNPYQSHWTIKVQLTRKGNIRTYNNARGEGCVLNVELTDEDVSVYHCCVFKSLCIVRFVRELKTYINIYFLGYSNPSKYV